MCNSSMCNTRYCNFLKRRCVLQEKGAGAPAGKVALKSGQAPKGRGFFTSAWVSHPAGHDKTDSPEQKKGVVTDPDLAPPKPESGKHDMPLLRRQTSWCVVLTHTQTCRVACMLHIQVASIVKYLMSQPSR